MRERRRKSGIDVIVAVSGGPDSVYLLHRASAVPGRILVAHVNHGARGEESDRDMRFVERLARRMGHPVRILQVEGGEDGAGPAGRRKPGRGGRGTGGFEEKARRVRHDFLARLKSETGAAVILLGHTADDQVETVLMRLLEGAGPSGLKGIPRESPDGIRHPLLDTWREDILRWLGHRGIRSRTDRSNRDVRFERNWIRHVLLPLLEKRYGKPVKKRLLALGERFRELDAFLEETACRWIRRNVGTAPDSEGDAAVFSRRSYGRLPRAVRIRILQRLLIDRMGRPPRERLLTEADRLLVSGGPSGRVAAGKGAVVKCRYEDAVVDAGRGRAGDAAALAVLPCDRPGRHPLDGCGGAALVWEEKSGALSPRRLRLLAADGEGAVFDADGLRFPLAVRPLRRGDRMHPFGLGSPKKVKEILIDLKVPRERRWGRPVVCDGEGEILWIPGVARSARAPVTSATRRSLLLRMERPGVATPAVWRHAPVCARLDGIRKKSRMQAPTTRESRPGEKNI